VDSEEEKRKRGRERERERRRRLKKRIIWISNQIRISSVEPPLGKM